MKTEVSNFDIKQIAESGQCFRINAITDNLYSVIHKGSYLEIEIKEDGGYIFHCKEEDLPIWYAYFDIFTKYEYIMKRADLQDEFLCDAILYGSGIRILKQDLWEIMVSFVMSAANSIDNIKDKVEKICTKYGELKESYEGKPFYTFPSPEKLTDEDGLRECGLGFRAKYVSKMAQNVVDGRIKLEYITTAKKGEVHNYLKSIDGIGDKIAYCIELFALNDLSAFPIDTWMQKIQDKYYNGKFPVEKYKGFEGVMQQYMFYYARNHQEEFETDEQEK